MSATSPSTCTPGYVSIIHQEGSGEKVTEIPLPPNRPSKFFTALLFLAAFWYSLVSFVIIPLSLASAGIFSKQTPVLYLNLGISLALWVSWFVHRMRFWHSSGWLTLVLLFSGILLTSSFPLGWASYEQVIFWSLPFLLFTSLYCSHRVITWTAIALLAGLSLQGYLLSYIGWQDLLALLPVLIVTVILAVLGSWYREYLEREYREAAAKASQSLQDLRERWRSLVESAPVMILNLDREGYVQFANRETPGDNQTIGKPVIELVDPAYHELLHQAIARVIEHGENARCEIRGFGEGDQPTWYAATLAPLCLGEQVSGLTMIATDIGERKRAEEKLVFDALHDRLTGLPNRALLVDRLNHAIARSRRHRTNFAVLFLDLDRFKVINDSLGHVIGDHLLLSLGERLTGALREADTIARLGGDEFVILLDDVDGVRDATRVSVRVLEILQEPFDLSGHPVVCGGSIGVVIGNGRSGSPDELLRDADIAMYRAKELGRGRYAVFDKDLHERAMRLLQMETDLRSAIEHGDFELHYQPIIALRKGRRVVGFEALIRWQHPLLGTVQPMDFIGMAEETNLIVPLGNWVLKEACVTLSHWQHELGDVESLAMSVNLSPRQLWDRNLLEQVENSLAESGVQPGNLILEITETAIIDDLEAATEVLTRLKGLGVQIHMDDFGVGYSSLNVLHQLPIDTLKIDRSFVHRMLSDRDSVEIVRSIIELGHNLNKGIVAEGIEMEEELALLDDMECEFGQGFFFSRPLERMAATNLLRGIP